MHIAFCVPRTQLKQLTVKKESWHSFACHSPFSLYFQLEHCSFAVIVAVIVSVIVAGVGVYLLF